MLFFSLLFAATTLAVPVQPGLEDLDLNLEDQVQEIQEIVIDDTVDEFDFDLDEEES